MGFGDILPTLLPRFSTPPPSSKFPSCSVMAHSSFGACPLSRDAATYRFSHHPLGRHCTPLSDPTPG